MCVKAYSSAHPAAWFSCLRCWRGCCRIAPLDTLLQLQCVTLLDLALGAECAYDYDHTIYPTLFVGSRTKRYSFSKCVCFISQSLSLSSSLSPYFKYFYSISLFSFFLSLEQCLNFCKFSLYRSNDYIHISPQKIIKLSYCANLIRFAFL